MALGDSDEIIKIRYVVDTQQAVNAATNLTEVVNKSTQSIVQGAANFRASVDAIKVKLLELSKQTGAPLKVVADQMKEALKTSSIGMNAPALAQANKVVSQALKETEAETRKLAQTQKTAATTTNSMAKSMLSLSSVAKTLSVALGIGLFSVIQSIVRGFQQGIEAGVEFSNQIYRLGASTRALQRAGLDVTINDAIESVEKLRKQFGFFSQKEAVQGVATIQLLSRSFDPTIEQMDQMTQAAVALSVVTGKDFAETSRELALFLSSGYAEAMQRAGLAVNRLRVAEEAQTMGIEKGYTALTEQERFVAGLSLVWKELAPIMDEVSGYQKSLAGQIKTTNAEIATLTDTITLQMAPLQKFWLEFKLWGINALYDLYTFIIKVFSNDVTAKLYGVFVGPFVGLAAAITALRQGIDLSAKDIIKIMVDAGKEMEAVWKNTGKSLIEDADIWKEAGIDAAVSLGDGAEEALKEQKIQEAFEDVMQELVDLAKETDEDFKDAFSDLTIDIGTINGGDLDGIMGKWNDFFSSTQDLTVDQVEGMQDEWESFFGEFGEIVDEGLDKAWEIWRDYYAKLADIDQKEQQDIMDAQRDLAYDIQDLNRDTQQKLEDAARKYRDGELKAERDYQEKLRRLREEFLFDLEDALRERDALQVLRLIRRYNLDKEQLERQGDLDAEERAENYRQEIEDIKRQAARKLEELQIENARRLQEIREQAAREREEAAIERDQAMQELKEDLEREREERLLKYEQEKEDIRKRFEEQLAEITKGLLEELGVTQENLDLIAGVFNKVFGEDGDIAKTYDVFASEMGNMETVVTNSVNAAKTQLELLATLSEAAAVRISAAAVTAVTAATQIQQANAFAAPYATGPSTPVPNYSGGTGEFNPEIPGFAFGGSVYANTPTMAMFGEVPEIATFTPLSKLNTSSMSPLGNASGQGGNMKIQILLSPGLEAQIIDNSLGSMAEILQNALGVR